MSTMDYGMTSEEVEELEYQDALDAAEKADEPFFTFVEFRATFKKTAPEPVATVECDEEIPF